MSGILAILTCALLGGIIASVITPLWIALLLCFAVGFFGYRPIERFWRKFV